ncbi:MAG: hypothetical protein AAF401_07845 [Pseudomonadota bacterium]
MPDGMAHPEHWPAYVADEAKPVSEPQSGPPAVPSDPAPGDAVGEKDGRIEFEGVAAPDRSELASVFDDLRADVLDLQGVGNLSNTSPIFAKSLDRFLETIPEAFEDLEQVRFGVAAQKMQIIFAAASKDLADSAPDKIGHVEAVLYSADLLKARLPEWAKFLSETEDSREIAAEKADELSDIAREAAEKMDEAPDSFAPAIAERLREYLEGGTTEGLLANKAILINIAHWIFTASRDLAKDTVSEVRKKVISGLVTAFVAQLGTIVLRLAGVLPNELPWIVRWLDYLPKLLGL